MNKPDEILLLKNRIKFFLMEVMMLRNRKMQYDEQLEYSRKHLLEEVDRFKRLDNFNESYWNSQYNILRRA